MACRNFCFLRFRRIAPGNRIVTKIFIWIASCRIIAYYKHGNFSEHSVGRLFGGCSFILATFDFGVLGDDFHRERDRQSDGSIVKIYSIELVIKHEPYDTLPGLSFIYSIIILIIIIITVG